MYMLMGREENISDMITVSLKNQYTNLNELSTQMGISTADNIKR